MFLFEVLLIWGVRVFFINLFLIIVVMSSYIFIYYIIDFFYSNENFDKF